MLNLIKALKFELTHSFTVLIASALLIFASLLSLTNLRARTTGGVDMNGGVFTVMSSMSYIALFLMITLFFACWICGWDFTDKTVNYEILAGHKRKEVYWSRVIVTLTVIIAGAVITTLPVWGVSLILGWGPNVQLSDVLLRYGLSLLAVVRLSCSFIFITFLTKNTFTGIVAGYIITLFSMMATIFKEFIKTDFDITCLFSILNLEYLLTFSNYELGFVDGKDVIVFITDVPTEMIVSTIVSSLVMSAVWLALGYLAFSKRDVN